MRRGTLLTGAEGRTFTSDLAALPRLVLLFVASGPLNIGRFVAQRSGFGAEGDAVS